MRWVAHAALTPHRCAAIPFIGNSNAKKGFIDTGSDLAGWDPHVYVSVEAVEEMARMVGWQPSHVQAGHKERAAEMQTKLDAANAEIERLEEQLAAVKVLKNGGFAQANPPGRPRKVAA
jgi:hypothetical protein